MLGDVQPFFLVLLNYDEVMSIFKIKKRKYFPIDLEYC